MLEPCLLQPYFHVAGVLVLGEAGRGGVGRGGAGRGEAGARQGGVKRFGRGTTFDFDFQMTNTSGRERRPRARRRALQQIDSTRNTAIRNSLPLPFIHLPRLFFQARVVVIFLKRGSVGTG